MAQLTATIVAGNLMGLTGLESVTYGLLLTCLGWMIQPIELTHGDDIVGQVYLEMSCLSLEVNYDFFVLRDILFSALKSLEFF